MAEATVEVKGVNGTVRFDGQMITIARKGFLARASIGKGDKQIPLAHVTAVQFKPAGRMVNGFIQFTLGGGNEKQSAFGSQSMDAAKDENSVRSRTASVNSSRTCANASKQRYCSSTTPHRKPPPATSLTFRRRSKNSRSFTLQGS